MSAQLLSVDIALPFVQMDLWSVCKVWGASKGAKRCHNPH